MTDARPPRRIFCDRIDAAAVAALRRAQVDSVTVLEAITGAQRAAARGIDVAEARFFAGHLRDREGEAVYLTARRRAGIVALECARRLVARHEKIATLDRQHGRGTVRLVLAKWLVTDVEAVIVRLEVARALAGDTPFAVWIALPSSLDPGLLEGQLDGMEVHYYPGITRSAAARPIRDLCAQLLRRAWSWLVPAVTPPDRGPSVLVVREDEVHLDRSHRGQPHWIDPSQPPPAFRTYVVPRGGSGFRSADAHELGVHGIHCLSRGDVARARRRHWRDPTVRGLRRAGWSCARTALRERGSSRVAHARVAIVLLRANEMAALARHLGARTFVFGEPYLIETDAMQLGAGALGVETIAWQYSNLAFMSPLMLNTADRMVLFSSNYRKVWEHDGIAPRRWEVGGYVFDGATARVLERARALRARLAAAGARFVLCYFDENVQFDRWGGVHVDDHREELRELLRLLLADDSVALIVKTQFGRNAPSRLLAGEPEFTAVLASGRYVELSAGAHRNNVYPVEAALAADLAIGHLIGATAALEAGLAGVRSLLLNGLGLRAENAALYTGADIVYPSMGALMAAIARLRAGDRAAARLGDWSPVAASFDPLRDGRAPQRLRAFIEHSLGSGALHPLMLDTQETA